MMEVIKFGGTSLQDKQSRQKAYSIILDKVKYAKVIVVVSAMGRMGDSYATDTLASLVNNNISNKERDRLISLGEIISSIIVCDELVELGAKAISIPVNKIGIYTDNQYGSAHITSVSASQIKEYLSLYDVVVVPGFQGISYENEIATLGKGGSDLSCVLLGAGLNLDEVEIYSNVSGIYSGDPKYIKHARLYPYVDYEDAILLAKSGASVIQEHSVNVAKAYNLKLHLKSTFEKDDGTYIQELDKHIKGISIKTNLKKVDFKAEKDIENYFHKISSHEYIIDSKCLNEIDEIDLLITDVVLITLIHCQIDEIEDISELISKKCIKYYADESRISFFIESLDYTKEANILHDVLIMEE